MKTKISFPLIASAVGLACASGAANAALVSVTQTFSSTQGNTVVAASNPDASVAMPDMVFRLQSDGYQVGHTVTLTLGGGGSIRSAAGIGTLACESDVAGASAGIVLKYVSATSSTITLNVDARADAAIDARGNRCSIAAGKISVLTSSLTSAKNLTIDYVANTGTANYDQLVGGTNYVYVSGATTAVSQTSSYTGSPAGAYRIHTSRGQFSASTTGTTTGVINVYNSTYDVTDMTTFATNPVAKVRINNVGASDINAISADSVTSIVTTLTGDFSYLDNDGNGCTVGDLTNGWGRATLTDDGSGLAINAACTSITFLGTLGKFATLTFEANKTAYSDFATLPSAYNGSVGAKPLPTQVISRSTVVNVLSGGTTSSVYTSSSSSANTWTTNGWTASVPYMPYGSGITRILYVTNNTGGVANVSLYAYGENGTACAASNFATVSVPANGVANLAASADAGIAACFGASYNGKVKFGLTSNLVAQSKDTVSLTLASVKATELSSATGGLDGTGNALGVLSDMLSIAGQTASGTVTRSGATIDLYSAYNVSGNRVTVQNSTNNR